MKTCSGPSPVVVIVERPKPVTPARAVCRLPPWKRRDLDADVLRVRVGKLGDGRLDEHLRPAAVELLDDREDLGVPRLRCRDEQRVVVRVGDDLELLAGRPCRSRPGAWPDAPRMLPPGRLPPRDPLEPVPMISWRTSTRSSAFVFLSMYTRMLLSGSLTSESSAATRYLILFMSLSTA